MISPCAASNDQELLVAGGAQRGLGGGGIGPGPDQAVAPPPEPPRLFEALSREQALLADERHVARRDGRLVGGGFQVRGGDVRVVQVDDGFFHAASEQALRLAHEVLVQGVLAGHQHGVAVPLPARASPALLEARHVAGVARQYRRIEVADVHPQLHGARGDEPVQLASREPPLDVAPVRRQVAARGTG